MTTAQIVLGIAIGVAAGVLSGLFGVGGGIVLDGRLHHGRSGPARTMPPPARYAGDVGTVVAPFPELGHRESD